MRNSTVNLAAFGFQMYSTSLLVSQHGKAAVLSSLGTFGFVIDWFKPSWLLWESHRTLHLFSEFTTFAWLREFLYNNHYTRESILTISVQVSSHEIKEKDFWFIVEWKCTFFKKKKKKKKQVDRWWKNLKNMISSFPCHY